MAATAQFYEDNGAATGSPAKGTTRAVAPNCDWKSVDDITTPRANATIIAGQNSYHKYQFVKFTGTFNSISAGKFAHTSGTVGTGLKIVDKISSTYATPTTADLSGSTDITTAKQINSGQAVKFSATGPEGSASDTLTSEGYTQYIITQLQTEATAAAGDIGQQELTFQWNEN